MGTIDQSEGAISVFVEEPERGWWEVRPAWAVRKLGEDAGEPYLLALDDDDLAGLIGEEAVATVKAAGGIPLPSPSPDGHRGPPDRVPSTDGAGRRPDLRGVERRAS